MNKSNNKSKINYQVFFCSQQFGREQTIVKFFRSKILASLVWQYYWKLLQLCPCNFFPSRLGNFAFERVPRILSPYLKKIIQSLKERSLLRKKAKNSYLNTEYGKILSPSAHLRSKWIAKVTALSIATQNAQQAYICRPAEISASKLFHIPPTIILLFLILEKSTLFAYYQIAKLLS